MGIKDLFGKLRDATSRVTGDRDHEDRNYIAVLLKIRTLNLM